MTGEPVASNRSMVSLTAASKGASSTGFVGSPAAVTAAIRSGGRGMLPIGSVGIISVSAFMAVVIPVTYQLGQQLWPKTLLAIFLTV